ncbi:MAG TPA: elongation factor G [Egibacteraceae bacterium]|nr:elongation factor G [Egibacteraceae bacterium]
MGDGVPTERIRNVVLLGHGGVGKTSLAEGLLAASGEGAKRGGVLDVEPEERERGHSLGLGVGTVRWRDHKLNILDTPGSPDAVGDAYPALTAADAAIFVIDAAAGVQPQHDELWDACARLGLPRVVVLNKLDKYNAAYQANIDALQERYGKPLAPVHMPMGVGTEFTGVIDLLHATAVQRVEGLRTQVPVPAERNEQAGRNRELLVEAIVEQDDDLLVRYLDGDVPETGELARCFAQGVASGGFFPVLCASAAEDIGVRLLADFIVEECPSPADRAARIGADSPTAAYVAKTLSDPYVGRITVLRVLAGRLSGDDVLAVQRTGDRIRVRQLFSLTGREQTPVGAVPAGDIVAVAKLENVATGDVLSAGPPVSVETIAAPEPFHRVAVEPATAGDEEKLSTALARTAEEDPSLRVEREDETGQLIVRAYGPLHVAVALARMERKFGVRVREAPLRIPYRETLKGPGSGVGKHVKQSGGHGQYGIAQVEVEPLPRDSGFAFEDRIVGGVIPRQFISSVEKGVVEAMAQGVLAGFPVVDARVRLVDGKHHSVDSSDMAFQVAGALAFRAAAQDAGLSLLEPIMELEVTIPDELTGDVMGDLSARRGRIQGTEAAGPGHTTVRALVPQSELTSFVPELRSLTSGTGQVMMRYDHHDECPEHLAKAVVAQATEQG